MDGLPIRKEVQDFLEASETLLSPALLGSDLTPEECLLIADYVMHLVDSERPWGTALFNAMRGCKGDH
jgi:hypothetical protein